MKKNKIYCIYCGTENNKMDKKCCECNKKLDPKEHQILDYLKDYIKDDLTGKAQDKVIDIIINYIKSHLYGLILTMSIIITTTAIVTTTLDDQSFEVVEEPPKEVVTYLGTGLDSSELTLKYFELLKNDKTKLASLLFEDKNLYTSTNHIYDNIEFFRNYYDSDKLKITRVIPNVMYLDGYEVSSVLTEYVYCKEDICTNETNNIKFVFIVECVEIDGNWYIFNEQIDFDVDDTYNYKMDMLMELKIDLISFIDKYYN